MKLLLKLLFLPTLLVNSSCNGQIKNAKTVSLKIDGNCGMCKKNIESVANKKNLVKVEWDKSTKIATVAFDTIKTSEDEVLKRIALAGYDNEKFLAPNDAYDKLPECCKYERTRKKEIATIVKTDSARDKQKMTDHQTETNNQLKPVLDNYLDLKNALVKSDFKEANAMAENLFDALSKIEMNKLEFKQHEIWMKVRKDLMDRTEKIIRLKNIGEQRKAFVQLSEQMYDLIKVADFDFPVYYQNCQMYNNNKGAKWLSLENTIKNPYYGSQMLTCGTTIETIK
jgi:hypothetical protein